MKEEIKKKEETSEESVPGSKIDVLKKYNVSGKMLNQSEIDMLVKRYKMDKKE